MTAISSLARPTYDGVVALVRSRSFATLATVTPDGRPHAAGVLYAYCDDAVYCTTLRNSRKARNIAAAPHVFMSIPVRRVPVGGPPSTVQFPGTAELLQPNDPRVTALHRNGKLKAITAHDELNLPDICVIRIVPSDTMLTYGLGLSLLALIRDPLHADGRVTRPR
jgi:general stress protein 26